MSKRLKTIEWKTNLVPIDFSTIANQPIGWALKAISEYRAVPADLYTQKTSKIPTADLLLKNLKGEPVKCNDAIDMGLDVIYAEWSTLLLWIAKDRWKLFSISDGPLPEVIMRAYEPRARLVLAELELWDAIFDASEKMRVNLPYKNCIEGWKLTQIESKRTDLSEICHGVGQHTRANNLAKQKAQLKLPRPVNPFHAERVNEAHHFNMIAAAISIAGHPWRCEQEAITEARKNFRRRAWKPFLEAMQEYTKSLRLGIHLSDGSKVKTKGKAIFVSGEHLMIQDGKQAKKVLPILNPPQNKSSHQRGKYTRKA